MYFLGTMKKTMASSSCPHFEPAPGTREQRKARNDAARRFAAYLLKAGLPVRSVSRNLSLDCIFAASLDARWFEGLPERWEGYRVIPEIVEGKLWRDAVPGTVIAWEALGPWAVYGLDRQPLLTETGHLRLFDSLDIARSTADRIAGTLN